MFSYILIIVFKLIERCFDFSIKTDYVTSLKNKKKLNKLTVLNKYQIYLNRITINNINCSAKEDVLLRNEYSSCLSNLTKLLIKNKKQFIVLINTSSLKSFSDVLTCIKNEQVFDNTNNLIFELNVNLFLKNINNLKDLFLRLNLIYLSLIYLFKNKKIIILIPNLNELYGYYFNFLNKKSVKVGLNNIIKNKYLSIFLSVLENHICFSKNIRTVVYLDVFKNKINTKKIIKLKKSFPKFRFLYV